MVKILICFRAFFFRGPEGPAAALGALGVLGGNPSLAL